MLMVYSTKIILKFTLTYYHLCTMKLYKARITDHTFRGL